MSRLNFDAVVELLWPVPVPPRRPGDPHLFVYFALVNVDGQKLPVHIARRVQDPEFATLHPKGTMAQVFGKAQVVGRSFFVDASTIGPTEPDNEDEPAVNALSEYVFLVFDGTVSSEDYAADKDDLTSVDITVEPACNWTDGPVTFRCQFDRTGVHLRDLGELKVGTAVVISATLVGVTDGLLTVNVHDVCFEKDANPCVAHSYVRDVPTELSAWLCMWLGDVREGARGDHLAWKP